MKELSILETEFVSGAGFFYSLGYAVGSAVEYVGEAIGGAIGRATFEATNAGFQRQYG